ncbi:putative membrane protein [Frankia casuarinae]|uniref:Membrane protein n=2 Tax=Frankiaceae TaxID=74712 RepID=Q2JBI8_FRACC|nr:putative membrane protein [Frankia casuarinae]
MRGGGGPSGRPRRAPHLWVSRAADGHLLAMLSARQQGMWRSRARRLWTSFWTIPALCTALAVGLAVSVPWLDERGLSAALPFLFSGGPDGARSVLSAVASSMISFTALVFSITIVTLQLTSGQFSPRVLRTFLQDRLTQLALGVFVATFVYALAVLRSVRGADTARSFVPRTAVTLSVLLVLISVVLFIAYIHHVTNAVRVSQILASIGTQTRRCIARRFDGVGSVSSVPLPTAARSPRYKIISAPRNGIIAVVRDRPVVRAASQANCLVVLVPKIGDFVAAGMPLFTVHDGPADGLRGDLDRQAVIDAVDIEIERSMEQDIAFGFRQLADIAERALSPAMNDHTTAVAAVDQVHDLLRRLVTRHLTPRAHTDRDGQPRLVVPEPDLEDYLRIGVDDISRWAQDSPRVLSRLRLMLRDVYEQARPEHRARIACRVTRLERRLAARKG